jgi:AAA15 family ATPase/GTPase
MLKQIHLERFKKFKDVSVELRPFTILMGENSSGKTTILQAINLALNILYSHDFITTRNGNLRIRSKGVGLTSLIGMSLADYRELYYGKIHRGGKTKGAGGTNIEIIDDLDNIYKFRITSLFGSYNIRFLSTTNDIQNNPQLQQKPPLFISGFVGLRPSEERAFPRTLQDRLRSGQVSAIIRNLVLDAKEKSTLGFNKLRERMAKDFNFYFDEDINFDIEHDLYVRAHYRDKCDTGDISLDFNSSGSGFMQILQILAPIYLYCQSDIGVVLLDEPDAHLHPNLQTSLAKALKSIQVELGIQIIISTHSTSIIRASDPSEIVTISASEKVNKPLISKVDVENQIMSHIDSYDLGKSILSGKILFIEDSDLSILETLDKVLESRCFYGPNTIPVISGRGKDDKTPYNLDQVLKKYIGKDIEIHVIRDSDGINDKWRKALLEYASKHNVILHILEKYEMENYLLDPDLLYKAIATVNNDIGDITVGTIKTKLSEVLKNTIEKASYRYENSLTDNIYKSASIVGDDEYRNLRNCESEAIKVRSSYEKKTDFEELLFIGMGKETLKEFLRWVNEDKKLKLSKMDILLVTEKKAICKEITDMLTDLQSKELK